VGHAMSTVERSDAPVDDEVEKRRAKGSTSSRSRESLRRLPPSWRRASCNCVILRIAAGTHLPLTETPFPSRSLGSVRLVQWRSNPK
jgi:hypothetical protein